MSDGCHFPVKDTDDSGFGLVKYQIVNFIIAVDQSRSVFGLFGLLLEESNHVVKMRYIPNRLLCLHVLSQCLCL